MKITINKIEYQIKFGYKATRILANLWGLEKPSEVEIKLASVLSVGEEATFEQLDAMGEFFLSGILAVDPGADLSVEDVLQAVIEQPELMEQIQGEYVDSLPVVNTADKGLEQEKKTPKKQ